MGKEGKGGKLGNSALVVGDRRLCQSGVVCDKLNVFHDELLLV